MNYVIKCMLMVVALLIIGAAPTFAAGLQYENGMVRYEQWVLADDCSMIESNTRDVDGVDNGVAFIHVMPNGDVYFKFERTPLDVTSRTMNIDGARDIGMHTVKTPWGFFSTPVTFSGNQFVLNEILNRSRIGVAFDSGVSVVWPMHGAGEAWAALQACASASVPSK